MPIINDDDIDDILANIDHDDDGDDELSAQEEKAADEEAKKKADEELEKKRQDRERRKQREQQRLQEQQSVIIKGFTKAKEYIASVVAKLTEYLRDFPWKKASSYSFLGSLLGLFIAVSFLSYFMLAAENRLNLKSIDLFNVRILVPVKPDPISFEKRVASSRNDLQSQEEAEVLEEARKNGEDFFDKDLIYSPTKSKHGPTPPFDFYRVEQTPEMQDAKSRIAIVVYDVGLRKSKLKSMFKSVPSYTTFAFSPYANVVSPAKDLNKTFENWLLLPTEVRRSTYDPGQIGLYNNRDIVLNKNALKRVLRKNDNVTGFFLRPYSAFPSAAKQYETIVHEIFNYGYGIMDASFEAIPPQILIKGNDILPYFQADTLLDESVSPDDIIARFNELEVIAKDTGSAIGVMRSFPVSLRILQSWSKNLEDRGFALVPLSSLAKNLAPKAFSAQDQQEPEETPKESQ